MKVASSGSLVGYHFSLEVRPQWRALAKVLDERARALGCSPPGEHLKPLVRFATIAGWVDWRLQRGGFRCDIVHQDVASIVNVRLGITHPEFGIRFGAKPPIGDWPSDDTVVFTTSGLAIPEQEAADERTRVPAAALAPIRLWDVMNHIAELEARRALADSAELAAAPGWRLDSDTGMGWGLSHPLIALTFVPTPMVTR